MWTKKVVRKLQLVCDDNFDVPKGKMKLWSLSCSTGALNKYLVLANEIVLYLAIGSGQRRQLFSAVKAIALEFH